MSQTESKTLRLYGCGGLGTNIVREFERLEAEPGYAKIQTSYLDTSDSNMRDGQLSGDVFRLEGTDGGGKVRKTNFDAIAHEHKKMVQAIQPADFNVVVYSASGSSGSTIGPYIHRHLLLDKNVPVVSIVVGTYQDILASRNTLDVLSSLENIARRGSKPVVVFFTENKDSEEDVNKRLISIIGSLSMLFSGQNGRLDTMDVKNWLDYTASTSVEPQLSLLSVYKDTAALVEEKDPISVISLFKEKPSQLPIETDYSSYGIHANEKSPDVHYVISVDRVKRVIDEINGKVAKQQERLDARGKSTSFSAGKTANDDGMVIR